MDAKLEDYLVAVSNEIDVFERLGNEDVEETGELVIAKRRKETARAAWMAKREKEGKPVWPFPGEFCGEEKDPDEFDDLLHEIMAGGSELMRAANTLPMDATTAARRYLISVCMLQLACEYRAAAETWFSQRKAAIEKMVNGIGVVVTNYRSLWIQIMHLDAKRRGVI